LAFFCRTVKMGAPRAMRKKSEKFNENINKRGSVTSASREENNGLGVGPIVVGFILFVVIGSSILQIVRSNA